MSENEKVQLDADDTQLSDSEETVEEQDQQEDKNPLLDLSKEELIVRYNQAQKEAGKYRKRGSAYKEELEAERKAKLKEQGKYKEMWQMSEQKREKLEGALNKGVKISSLKAELSKLGCDATMLSKALKHADLDQISVDPETLSADIDAVKFIAKQVKEDVPVFFGKAFNGVKDGTPGDAPKTTGSKRIKQMSDEDLDKAYLEALSNL